MVTHGCFGIVGVGQQTFFFFWGRKGRNLATKVLKTQVQSGHPRYNRLSRLPCLLKDYKLKIFRGYPGVGANSFLMGALMFGGYRFFDNFWALYQALLVCERFLAAPTPLQFLMVHQDGSCLQTHLLQKRMFIIPRRCLTTGAQLSLAVASARCAVWLRRL